MIIYVDGSIGVGKTTLLKSLESAKFDLPHIVVQEPVGEWLDFRVDSQKESLFELFYNDKTKYGFMFQMMALQSRISNLIKIQSENVGKVLICERSFMTDYQIFAKGMHADGHISDMEMAVYLKWYNYCIEHVKPRVDGIIYLRALPETCLGRINQRARAGEDVIDLEYLTKLHVAHEDWLLKRDDVFVADAANQLDMATIVSFIQGRIAALASPNPRMSII